MFSLKLTIDVDFFESCTDQYFYINNGSHDKEVAPSKLSSNFAITLGCTELQSTVFQLINLTVGSFSVSTERHCHT